MDSKRINTLTLGEIFDEAEGRSAVDKVLRATLNEFQEGRIEGLAVVTVGPPADGKVAHDLSIGALSAEVYVLLTAAVQIAGEFMRMKAEILKMTIPSEES